MVNVKVCAGDVGCESCVLLATLGDAACTVTTGGWCTTWCNGLELTEGVLLGALEGPLEVTMGALDVG